MTTVSIEEASKTLPALLQRARTESVFIRDENGTQVMLLSFGHESDQDREKAWGRADELSKQGSQLLEDSLAKDGITVEAFLADAFADD